MATQQNTDAWYDVAELHLAMNEFENEEYEATDGELASVATTFISLIAGVIIGLSLLIVAVF